MHMLDLVIFFCVCLFGLHVYMCNTHILILAILLKGHLNIFPIIFPSWKFFYWGDTLYACAP